MRITPDSKEDYENFFFSLLKLTYKVWTILYFYICEYRGNLSNESFEKIFDFLNISDKSNMYITLRNKLISFLLIPEMYNFKAKNSHLNKLLERYMEGIKENDTVKVFQTIFTFNNKIIVYSTLLKIFYSKGYKSINDFTESLFFFP